MNIGSLRCNSRVSVTSIKGILQKHCEQLDGMLVYNDFDDDWKEWVENIRCMISVMCLA